MNPERIIIIDDEYYPVEDYSDDIKLKKNVAYIKGNMVYVYYGKKDSLKIVKKPGIYKINDSYVFIEPDESNSQKYHIDNINDLNPETIFARVMTHKQEFLNSDDIEVINSNAEIYKPVIKEDDDFLKFIIKKAITDKDINLKNYRSRFGSDYSLNNMKSALTKQTKMTVLNFLRWIEILGLEFTITVSDSGEDKANPLPEPITITSRDIF